MADQPIAIMIAGITKPGMEDYVRDFLLRLENESKDDAGCLLYNLHESTMNPGEFMLYSVWKNEAAFEKHNQTPLMQEFKKELAKNMFDHESPKTYWKIINK